MDINFEERLAALKKEVERKNENGREWAELIRKLFRAAYYTKGEGFLWKMIFSKDGDCVSRIAFGESVETEDIKALAGEAMCFEPEDPLPLHEKAGTYFLSFEKSVNHFLNDEGMEELLHLFRKEECCLGMLLVPGEENVRVLFFLDAPKRLSLKLKTMVGIVFSDCRLLESESIEQLKEADEDVAVRFIAATQDCYFRLKRYETGEEEEEPVPLEELGLSVRAFNCLRRAGIETLDELRRLDYDAIASIRNMGRKSTDEIMEKLREVDGAFACPEEFEAEDFENWPEGEKEEERSAFEELDSLVGLEGIKTQVRRLVAFAKMKKTMENGERRVDLPALNMVFSGNPGTAKTTVARILARFLHEVGLLKSSEIVEVGSADLVGQYVGQTAPKVREVFEEAEGHLLFVDEAYSLCIKAGKYGDEAIAAIIQEMENRKGRMAVVFAGYPDKMEEFVSANPGLRSRIPFTIRFEDYSVDELVQICRIEAERRCFSIDEAAEGKIRSLCEKVVGRTQAGNGRFCRNLVENAVMNYASRNYSEGSVPQEEFCLQAEDFCESEVLAFHKKRLIGFTA